MNRETNKGGEPGIVTHDAAAINYLSSSKSKPLTKIRFDDLIVSLANSHENRRARQVNEWERLRNHNMLYPI